MGDAAEVTGELFSPMFGEFSHALRADSIFVLVPNSGADTDIIVPISVLSSLAALVSFAVTGSGLLTEVGDDFSCPSGSPCWASFTFLFFKERSFPIGPGLYSLFSTGLKSGS